MIHIHNRGQAHYYGMVTNRNPDRADPRHAARARIRRRVAWRVFADMRTSVKSALSLHYIMNVAYYLYRYRE
jgi:hypothetical protein